MEVFNQRQTGIRPLSYSSFVTIISARPGVFLMRRYAEGEDVGELLGAMAGTVEKFYQKFYGLKVFEGIPADRKAHLDHCLEVQRTVGPTTKGSNLYIYGGNERRE